MRLHMWLSNTSLLYSCLYTHIDGFVLFLTPMQKAWLGFYLHVSLYIGYPNLQFSSLVFVWFCSFKIKLNGTLSVSVFLCFVFLVNETKNPQRGTSNRTRNHHICIMIASNCKLWTRKMFRKILIWMSFWLMIKPELFDQNNYNKFSSNGTFRQKGDCLLPLCSYT